jgi:hypothetical protein
VSNYVQELEAELVRAGRARQRRRTAHLRARGSGVPIGGVLTGLGAGASIAVVILAIVLLGHTRPRPVRDGVSLIPPSARSLVAQLAVLRRPQTAMDKTGPEGLLRILNFSADQKDRIAPQLTRLLATLPGISGGTERVFLVITVPPATSDRSVATGRAFASLATVSTRSGQSSGGTPAAVFYTRMSSAPSSAGGYDTTIVPDGVTAVRWDFDGQPGAVTHPQALTLYPTVRSNLAFAPARRDQGDPARITWYGPHHRILKTINGPFRQATLVDRPAAHNPMVMPTPEHGKPTARIPLRPLSETHRHVSGIAEEFAHAHTRTVSVIARGLAPNPKHDTYAIWLYRSPTKSILLGFVSPRVRANGRLNAAGVLPPNAKSYKRILLTRETNPRPASPGKIILQGSLNGGSEPTKHGPGR